MAAVKIAYNKVALSFSEALWRGSVAIGWSV